MRALLPNVVDVLMHGAAGFGWRAGFDGFEHFPVFKAIFIGEDDEIQLALFFELFLKFCQHMDENGIFREGGDAVVEPGVNVFEGKAFLFQDAFKFGDLFRVARSVAQ